MQVVHRISDPEALRWSNRCRVLYRDFGVDYEQYAMGTLDDRCFVVTAADRLTHNPSSGYMLARVRARCHTPWSSWAAWIRSQSS